MSDGIDRRGLLSCMAWVGTGIVWTLAGGVPRSLPIERAEAADLGPLSFVQISDSHIGFNKDANTDVPGTLKAGIDRIRALMNGEKIDLADSPLDLTGLADFDLRVYRVALSIPPGETLTYGEVARRIGEPQAAQTVGQSLGRNPIPIIVPCHRVLAASGRTGGFSAPGGVSTKLKLLSIERARTGEPTLFDDDPAFGFAARPR